MIVMKFGGTSVQDAKAIDRVAAIVRRPAARKSPWWWSAPWPRSPTSLLAMAARRRRRRPRKPLKLCRRCTSATTTPPENCSARLFTEFHCDWSRLRKLWKNCCAASRRGRTHAAHHRHVSAFGEMLSSKIVAAAFAARGMKAAHVDSRECIVTDSAHIRAAPLFEETNAATAVESLAAARRRTSAGHGRIHRLPTKAGITTTIGRGGSDFRAAIVGAGWTPNASRSGPTWTA